MLVTEADGPTSTPGCWFCHILTPSRIFAYWHIIYAVRIWAEGSSSSRNRAAPVAFVLEVFTKTQYVESCHACRLRRRYVCVDFTSLDESWNTSHTVTNRLERARTRRL
jgi:hypothetical protein